MKKSFAIFLLITYVFSANAKKFTTSRSFLFYRPIYQNVAAVESLWHNIVHQKEDLSLGMQAIGLYHKSLDRDRIGNYFLLNCKNCITIKGDNTSGAIDRDIRAEFFGLPSNYDGTFSLHPKQEQACGIIEYCQSLSSIYKCDLTRNRWFSIRMPLQWVKNSLNPSQSIINSGITNINTVSNANFCNLSCNTTLSSCNNTTLVQNQPTNFIEAMNQPDITNSRIYSGNKDKFGLAEIRLSLGSTILDHNDFHFSYYSTFVIPTAHKQRPEFLFNPFLGVNGHFGLGGAVRLELPLHECDSNYKALFFLHLEGIYYFHSTECRTFDLVKPIDRGCFCPKTPNTCTPTFHTSWYPLQDILDVDMSCKDNQWSRFLLFRKPGHEQTIRGVNILTFPVRVWPFGIVDFNTGFKFNFCNFEGEIGYSIWGRSHEEIMLKFPECDAQPYEFEKYGIAGSTPNTSASRTTISSQALDDPTFVFIRPEDISFASGAFAGAVLQRAYASLGFCSLNTGLFAGIGGYYEVPFLRYKNSAFKAWGLWFKFGAGF